MASLEVDLNKIEPGQTITVKWRGKPVFIKRRTDEDIAYARDVDVSTLRDPQTDEERTQNPEVQQLHEILQQTVAAAFGSGVELFMCLLAQQMVPVLLHCIGAGWMP